QSIRARPAGTGPHGGSRALERHPVPARRRVPPQLGWVSDCRSQPLLDLIEVEGIRVPPVRQPSQAVAGVGEDFGLEVITEVTAHPLGQLVVASDPAAVLGWAGVPTGDAPRNRRRGDENLIDPQHMRPTIAEVIVVPETISCSGDDLIEANVVFERPLVALTAAEFGGELH